MSLWLSFLLIFASSLFLFFKSLNYYFFQDDWFVLNWVLKGDWLALLNFRGDIIYWRPISMPIFFKLANVAFGLNPLPFHQVAFAIHLLNTTLIFLLFRQLKNTVKTSLLIAFLYATAAFHFIPLSWLSTTSYIIGPTFIFASLLFFLKNRSPRPKVRGSLFLRFARNKIAISFVFFLLALASSELALTLIPIAILLSPVDKTNIKKLAPFGAIAILYLIARFFFLPLPQEGEYALTLAPKILTNIFWYFAWTFNMPETLSTVFYFTDLRHSLLAILDFWQYAILPIVLSGFFIFLITKVSRAIIARGFSIFLFGLIPVIFLPFHIYPMYLTVSSLGVFYILANYFDKFKKPFLPVTFCAVWFVASFLTINFTRSNHWLVNLQAIAKTYVNFTKGQIQNPPQGSTFIFKFPDIEYAQEKGFVIVQSEQNILQALNREDAMQVVYHDKSIKTLYETGGYIPQAPPNSIFFTIQPR